MRRHRFLLCLAAVIPMWACSSTVPASITQQSFFMLEDEPRMMLDATAQGPRIAKSLGDAGIVVVRNPRDANYRLTVQLGDSRSSQDCGTKRNVKYLLFNKKGRVMVIKARGWTGNCKPNVFDEMSALLASQFTGRDG